MKKFIIFVTLFLFFFHLNFINAQSQKQIEEINYLYQEGLKLFNNGDYRKSIILLELTDSLCRPYWKQKGPYFISFYLQEDFRSIKEWDLALNYGNVFLNSILDCDSIDYVLLMDEYYLLSNCSYNAGNNERAINFILKSIDILDSNDKANIKKRIDYFNDLSVYYDAQGNYEKAIKTLEEILPYISQLYRDTSNNYAFYLDNLALYHYRNNNFEEALKYGEKAYEILNNPSNYNNPEFISLLTNYSSFLNNTNRQDNALEIIRTSLNLCEKYLKNTHPYYLRALTYGIEYTLDKELFIETESYGEYLFKALDSISIPSNIRIANSLHNVALIKDRNGYFDMAIQYEMKALLILQEYFKEESQFIADCFNNLSVFLTHKGNLEEAIKYNSLALEIREKNKNSIRYLETLDNRAGLLIKLGKYSEAFNLHDEILERARITLDDNPKEYISYLYNWGERYSIIGDYEHALKYEQLAFNLCENLNFKTSKYYLNIINGLCIIYYKLGLYDQAANMSAEIFNIYKNKEYENIADMVLPLINVVSFYNNLEHYTEATELINKLYNLIKNTWSIDHPFYMDALETLTPLLCNIGQAEKAIELIDNFKNFEKNQKFLNIEEQINLLKLESQCYFLKNEYSKAEDLMLKALNLIQNINGVNNIHYMEAASLLSRYYYLDGKYHEALSFIPASNIHMLKRKGGNLNNDYCLSLRLLGALYDIMNNEEELTNIINKLNFLVREIIQQNFTFLTSYEREGLWIKCKPLIEDIQLYTAFYPNTTNISENYNASLLSKGILLNSEIEFDKFLVETGKPELAEKYNEIRSLRLQLNKLYEKPIAERGIDTDSLERVANNLERELMYESKEFGDYTRNLSITWQDVQKGLKQKDVAVEFVSFPLNRDSTMYMAYVLKPEMDSPQMVKLFEEKELASLSSAENPADLYNKVEASNLIWRKLEPYLEGCENVYFAPDGILHQTAIEYLPDFNGEGMMADRYNLHRLSSTRQLAVSHDRNESTSAAVYGGIVYDTDVDSMKAESRKYIQEKEEGVFLAQRGFNPFINYADILNTRLGVRYLDGTRIEAEEVNQSLLANNYQTQLVVGTRATEESFKNLSGKGNGIIHIATHGFYWQEDEADRMARSNERLMFMSKLNDNGPRYVEDKALTRSGLFMSGVNNILRGDTIPEGVDDGILTAQEIAQMNLRGTDLVVLSACQTGLGEISGDGVFGLQRGFKKAGANSLLMSLWKVDDDATRILMEAFYRNLMSGQSKQQSLRNAQKALLDDGFDDPKFWAAFILLDGLN